jgi:hypothetical protein
VSDPPNVTHHRFATTHRVVVTPDVPQSIGTGLQGRAAVALVAETASVGFQVPYSPAPRRWWCSGGSRRRSLGSDDSS